MRGSFTAIYNRGDARLKDDMYSYHYYKRRSILRPSRTSDYLVQAALFCGLAYAVVTVFAVFR